MTGSNRMYRMIVSGVLAAMLALSTFPATSAFTHLPTSSTIAAITETYTPEMPDDDDGTAEEKEELKDSNEAVPEGVDSTAEDIT